MVVLEVGEEVKDVGAAHRAAGPLAVTSPPQRMETASLTENIYLVIIHIIVVAVWYVGNYRETTRLTDRLRLLCY